MKKYQIGNRDQRRMGKQPKQQPRRKVAIPTLAMSNNSYAIPSID
jgi:hypothetical protein